MKNKYLAILFLLALLLAACSTGSKEEPTPTPAPDTLEPAEADTTDTETESTEDTAVTDQEVTTITMAVFDWDSGRYDDLIETFEAENPDVAVKTVSINETLDFSPTSGDWPDDADMRLASAADVVNISVSRENIDQGLILDLTPFLEAESGLADDFYIRLYWSGMN